MDSLYHAGECYFFADQYPQANLYYEKLIKAFPHNRYLDTEFVNRFEFLSNTAGDVNVDAVILLAHQRFAGDLQEHAAIG